MEREIARLDEAVKKAVLALGEHDYGSPEYERALEKYDRLKEQLEREQRAWEELYGQLADCG